MRALQFAPATYYAAISRPTSARAVRDEELVREIQATYDENHFVYGARKIWVALNKRGISVARCTVERLMGDMGLVGARRGRAFKVTTLGDDRLPRPADLVERDFSAPGPNRLWVADLTYVKTHTGWVYVAFVVDVFSRRVVGWQVSTSLRSDLAIDALEMAVYARRDQDLTNLVHHSDMGVQYLSIATPSDWPRPERSPPSVLEATAMTTPWPSPSTASTRPSSSIDEGPGRTPTTSNGPR